jgi:hypothetical protein
VSATLKETRDPLLRQALERWSSSHPDPEEAVEALNELLEVDTYDLSRLLQKRIDLAKENGDSPALRTLGRAQERLGSSGWGVVSLPSFFWNAPPVFSAKAASAPIRVLAISDFGTGDEEQRLPAEAMPNYQRPGRSILASRWGQLPGRWRSVRRSAMAPYWEQTYARSEFFYASMAIMTGFPTVSGRDSLLAEECCFRLPAPTTHSAALFSSSP